MQRRGWASISQGKHTLLCAPTGSGKTLAASLWCLDRLVSESAGAEAERPRGYSVVYVSPIKALAYDVERNLRAPLLGIQEAAERLGLQVPKVGIDVRTSDTPARERQSQKRKPGQVLITTPESLFLLLGSQARENLRSVRTVIVDEIHALAATKRGAHLAVSLERLCELTAQEPQRVGLSATQRPLELVGQFLGGVRAVEVIDASAPPALSLSVEFLPVELLSVELLPAPLSAAKPVANTAASVGPGERGRWPSIYRRLLELVEDHHTTLVFVNNRAAAERVAQQLCDMAGRPLALPHHGSLSHGRRQEVEAALKEGRVPCIVATSSLELGIDMGAIGSLAGPQLWPAPTSPPLETLSVWSRPKG